MITQQTYSLLALHVYDAKKVENKPILTGWSELPPVLVGTSGFAYAIYQGPGSEIVISFRGTDAFVSGDMLTNLGLTVSQERQAAEVYARVLRDNPTANITFTGHSLGGGLAGTMAVWFNRQAVVFDPAPTEIGAKSWLNVSYVIAMLDAPVPQSIRDYRSSISAEFSARESQVSSYYAPGSIVFSGNYAFNTITGAGQGNPVNFGIDNMGSPSGRVDMHSQALLTAGLLTPAFPTATVAVQNALPVIMDEKFYNLPTSGDARNFLIDIIRSEQNTPGNSKLSNFSEDLSKLGTNLAGLNAAAQKAIVAQGIEWYYWQGTDYAGQNFLINNATYPGLLQYTSAVGAALPDAKDKAFIYVDKWLTPLYNANGAFGGRNSFDQWSVVADNAAVDISARTNTKSQIFIGQDGADKFVGGDVNDVLMGGNSADSLEGGKGHDYLYGGAGNDTYTFSGSAGNFGSDVIQDSDSAGEIKVDGTTLNGGKKVDDNVWESADGIYHYQLFSHGATSDLVIGRGSKAEANQMQGSIVIKGWTGTGLGLTLSTAMVPVPAGIKNYNGDQRGPLAGSEPDTYYNWGVTTWAPDGSLTGGVAEANFADVIYGVSVRDDGDDLIAGGAGSDNISGGVGISTFLPQMEYGNTLVSHPLIHTAKSFLTTIASFKVKYLGRRCKMIERVKINSKSSKFHESRCSISIKNRLRRSQYTLNGCVGEPNTDALYSIADHAWYSWAAARVYVESGRHKAQKWQFHRSLRCSNAKTSHAHSLRLAGHKGLERRMDSAWAHRCHGASGNQFLHVMEPA